mgnify:CR=1 FL=1
MPRKAKVTSKPTTTDVQAVEIETKVVEKPAEKPRDYQPFDLIPCQSLVSGTMFYISPKSNTKYTWADNGEIIDMTYEDLLAMKQTHSQLMYRPCFMIMDEELLAHPRWSDVAKIYANYDVLSLGDAEKVIGLDANSLKKALERLTPAMRVVICNTAADMIEKGSLDSIAKIKAIDEVCGTELYTVAFR